VRELDAKVPLWAQLVGAAWLLGVVLAYLRQGLAVYLQR
jgi:hypothetical protein